MKLSFRIPGTARATALMGALAGLLALAAASPPAAAAAPAFTASSSHADTALASSWQAATGARGARGAAPKQAPHTIVVTPRVEVVGTDNQVYGADPATPGYVPEGGRALGAPAVYATTGGKFARIVTGFDHDLWILIDGGGWQKLSPASNLYCIDNPAAVVATQVISSTTRTILYVACQGRDHAVWGASMDLPAGDAYPVLSGWSSLGGNVISGPALLKIHTTTGNGDSVFLAVVGTDRYMYLNLETTFNAWAKWAPWQCSGHPAGSDGVDGVTGFLACDGLDGAFWIASYTENQGPYFPTSWGGHTIDGPGVTVNASGNPVAYVEGTDGAVWTSTNGGAWTSMNGHVLYGVGAGLHR